MVRWRAPNPFTEVRFLILASTKGATMYYRDLETNKEEMQRHNDNQKKNSSERLKKVAALKKSKK